MQSSQTHIPTSDFQEGIFPVSTLEARPSVAELPFFNAALYAETRFSLRVGTGARTGVSLSSWVFWRVCSFFGKKQPGGSLREREQAFAMLSQKKSKKSLRRRRKASLVCACKRNIMKCNEIMFLLRVRVRVWILEGGGAKARNSLTLNALHVDNLS